MSASKLEKKSLLVNFVVILMSSEYPPQKGCKLVSTLPLLKGNPNLFIINFDNSNCSSSSRQESYSSYIFLLCAVENASYFFLIKLSTSEANFVISLLLNDWSYSERSASYSETSHFSERILDFSFIDLKSFSNSFLTKL